jgi:3-hydroxyacyl-[acyl-carrier-protein] dehydratase
MATVDCNISRISRLPVRSAAALDAVECVDHLVSDAGVLTLRATKKVNATDPYMVGHFPGFTIYPGVFVLETVAQAAAAALGEPVRIVSVRSMRFTAPLYVEDVLVVDASVVALGTPGKWFVDASCRRLDGADSARIKIDLQTELPSDARVR